MSRIFLTTAYTEPGSKETAWYRHFEGNCTAGFSVETKKRGWYSLMEFMIPRPLTHLIPDPEHPVESRLQVDITWDSIQSFDFTPYLDCFPRKIEDSLRIYNDTQKEIEDRRRTQLTGWCRLVAIHLATGQGKSLPGLDQQTAFWESYLYEELCDFPFLKAQAPKIVQDFGNNEFRQWIKIASCTAEILWQAQEARAILAAARVAPYQFPCLAAGLTEAHKHGGIK